MRLFRMKLDFLNQILSKKSISEIISLTHRECGKKTTAQFLDDLKTLGFTYAMKSGASVGYQIL